MTNDQFTTRYPEFDTIDPDFVSAVLAEVAAEIDPTKTLYGVRYDAAQGALVAHRIYISPFGSSLRGDNSDLSTSTYLAAFKQMAMGSVVVSSPRRGW